MPTGNWINVIPGDEVAILPTSDSPASEVLDIKTVQHVGPAFIRLSDGQVFAQFGGAALYGPTYIMPANEQHLAELKAKRN
jgi:hypothetical protein